MDHTEVFAGDEHIERLFSVTPVPRLRYEPLPCRHVYEPRSSTRLEVGVSERIIDVFERVEDPEDVIGLRDLFLGGIEADLGSGWRDLDKRWHSARRRRHVTPDEVLSFRATAGFVKELFNTFFRDDLHGRLRSGAPITTLSQGSVDEVAYGLPSTLTDCLRYALSRDWYGYSDSRGRERSRAAIAALENVRIEGAPYGPENISLTLGGTFGISAIADFFMHNKRSGEPALCALPNYPPLVESIARRSPVRLVPMTCADGRTHIDALLDELSAETPLVLLQTVTNPSGTTVLEEDIARLVRAASPSTMIILDEAHECLGPAVLRTRWRAASNVVRVISLSKLFSIPGMKLGWMIAHPDFVRDYYEYASTTYGGPASFFSLMVAMLAHMERWCLESRETVGNAEVLESDDDYGLRAADLNIAYQQYRADREFRDNALIESRKAFTQRLRDLSFSVVEPAYSINIVARPPDPVESYLWFRRALAGTGVAVYPGILNFCLDGGWVRFTTSRNADDLSTAIKRLGGGG